MLDNEPELESKPFLDHLEDLRVMLFKSVFVFGVGVAACFIYTKPLLDLLLFPLVKIGQDPKSYLRVLGVVDPLTIQIEISMMGGFVLTLPFLLYFLGKFVLPALTPREKKMILPVFAAGGILFLIGVVFCYFLLIPQTLEFFISYNDYLGVRPEWTLQNYIDFIVQMVLGFGLAFELPLVVLGLHWFGLVSNKALREHRRHAAVIVFIAACCITPTSDLFTLSLLVVPMYFLYEVCIWITWWHEKRNKQREITARIEN